MAPATEPASGGSGVLTRKYGPLPGWAWLALVVVGAVVFWWWRNRNVTAGGTAVGSTAGGDSGAASGGLSSGFGGQPFSTLPSNMSGINLAPSSGPSGQVLSAGSSNPYLTQGGQVTVYQLINGVMTAVSSIPWGTILNTSGPAQEANYGPGGQSQGLFFPTAVGYVSASDVSYPQGVGAGNVPTAGAGSSSGGGFTGSSAPSSSSGSSTPPPPSPVTQPLPSIPGVTSPSWVSGAYPSGLRGIRTVA